MNAEQWMRLSKDYALPSACENGFWEVIHAIAAAGIDTDEAARRIKGEACPKPDAERHAAITIAMNVAAGADVERPAALRMVQWVLSQKPPWVIDEACRLVRDKWPAPESLERVAEWVLSRPADAPVERISGEAKAETQEDMHSRLQEATAIDYSADLARRERERRRWELYRWYVTEDGQPDAKAATSADAAIAAYYGEQHGS